MNVNDSLSSYNFYNQLNLGDIQKTTSQEIGCIDTIASAQEEEKNHTKKASVLPHQAVNPWSSDSISSAQKADAVVNPPVPSPSMWDWFVQKGESAWQTVKGWLSKKPNQNSSSEPDAALEKEEIEKLRKEIRESLHQLNLIKEEKDDVPDADSMIQHLLRKLSSYESQKTADLLDDFQVQKKKNNLKRKQYFQICDEYIDLEKKRKVAEWIEWGASLGGMVVGGLASLVGAASDGQVVSKFVQSALQGGLSAIQGTTQATHATFKHVINQKKARMIDLKEKLREQDEKVSKVVRDIGESYRRDSKHFQHLSKCVAIWRQTMISFFRR